MIATLITTYNRPQAITRTAAQVAPLRTPVLVVDDGSSNKAADENRAICEKYDYKYLRLAENRGLACAMNVGLAYWLADSRIEAINYLQDDVEVNPQLLAFMARVRHLGPLLTGHHAAEHPVHGQVEINGLQVLMKPSCRATHMLGTAEFWRSVMPLPTNYLGTPMRAGKGQGIGSNVDWWIVRDAPLSIQNTARKVVCVPGLVRSFYHHAKDSCWNNESKGGEEPPLAELWIN